MVASVPPNDPRSISGQVYDAQIASGDIQIPDVYNTDFGFRGDIDEEGEFYSPYGKGLQGIFNRLSNPVKVGFEKYAKPVLGGLFSYATGIPGFGMLINALSRFKQPNVPNPLAQGVYTDPSTGFLKDKFGYNVGPTIFKSNYMQPGSNSYRSYALEGLRSLDKNKASAYYEKTYGIKPKDGMSAFDIVKKSIQQKKDPFGSGSVIDMGADYQGGGDNENRDFNNPANIGRAPGSPTHSTRDDLMAKGGRVRYSRGGLTSL